MPRIAFKDRPLLFLDVETGGLRAAEHDVIEVAAIRTDPSGQNVLEEFSARVFPDRPVDPEAARINGYSEALWSQTAIPARFAWQRVEAMSQDTVLGTHNVGFDWPFVDAAFAKYRMRWRGDIRKICTVALAMPLLQAGIVSHVNLQTLAAHFKIDPGEPHRALSDARTCRRVYVEIMKMIAPALRGAAV